MAPEANAAALESLDANTGGSGGGGGQGPTKKQRVRMLYVANVGDSRAVLCRKGRAVRLTYDHKGSDAHEGRRVADCGGMIFNARVNGVLAVTRALGDSYMKDLVTGRPFTTETMVDPEKDEFMILACDGLWDVCSDQEAVGYIRDMQDPQDASQALLDLALSKFSSDNLSCMVVRFDRDRVRAMADHSVIPAGLSDGTACPADQAQAQNTTTTTTTSSSSSSSVAGGSLGLGSAGAGADAQTVAGVVGSLEAGGEP
ncbi:Protein phosphatase 2C 1 [Ascosphaera acerosa]|nr:Protein phosphatase 2C 1 [Ascosphaera acerosa]